MSATAARAVLRPSRLAIRQAPSRNASTTSEATSAASSTATKAKENISQAPSKASEGLTRVRSAGGNAMNKSSAAVSRVVDRIGGRTGRLISRAQALVPPTVYYSKVGFEVSKLVFRGQSMSPPSGQQVRAYFQPLVNAIRTPSSLVAQNPGLLQPQQYLNTIRSINRQQLITAGIVTAEVLGFFTVGEMIGKRKIIGYSSDAPAAEHH